MAGSLPYTPLPLFEGRQPSSGRMKLTGTVNTTVRAMQIGEEVYVIAKAAVVSVDHHDDDGTIVRIHKLKLDQAHELPSDPGEMALVEGQDWSRKIDDAQQGRLPLEGGDR